MLVALGDPDPRIRRTAVEALGEIGGNTAKVLWQQSLLDADDIREAAQQMLAEPGLAEPKVGDGFLKADRIIGELRHVGSTPYRLAENDEVRAMTRSSGTCARRLSNSSEMPWRSASSSLSALMFTNGSTAMERSVAIVAEADGGGEATVQPYFARALVVPEHPAAEQQEQREIAN